MRVCIGMALVLAMLLGGPIVVPVLCAEYQVTLGDTTGSNYSATPPFQSAAQRTPGKNPCCVAVALGPHCVLLSA